jgi:5-methylcytosine-specific restriction endonuclease McrA
VTEKRQRKADQAKARKACVEAVWRRAGGGDAYDGEWARCEGVARPCGNPVKRGAEFTLAGHVDEIKTRAQGGDPTNPANCRLLCRWCHFSGPSRAHRVTPNWRQGRV